MIKSVSENQQEILTWIRDLYCPDGFELDPTYSEGQFYKGTDLEPEFRCDLSPKSELTYEADCRNLPFEAASIRSIVFDPPFLAGGNKDNTDPHSSIIMKRFSFLRTQHDIRALYMSALVEFHRILRLSGILVFKCQDTVQDHKQVMNHCHIWQMAVGLGFIERDLFVLIASNRLIGGNHQVQQHARKFHSYFWVFEKGCRR